MCDKENCCCCYGPQGPQGVMGLQGSQGVQGIAGKDGSPGPKGPQGPQGEPGKDGQHGLPGPQGQQGTQGVPGLQGPEGHDGLQGAIGPQGAQGIPGPQGAQGIQGVPGKDCDNTHCCFRSANIYATIPQIIGPYSSATDTVILDATNWVSPGSFDLTNTPSTGEIIFLKKGVYHLQWQLQARITPPVPNPVPSWSFGFWVNGVLVPGSIYSRIHTSSWR